MIEDLDDPTTNNCFHLISNTEKAYRVRVLVLNATFNNISAISWGNLDDKCDVVPVDKASMK
jgi:hypothetical protein